MRACRRSSLAALVVVVGVAACGSGQVSSSTTTTTSTTTATPTAEATTATVAQILPGTGRPQIAVGDKNTPEQFILGELYDLALSAEGFNVTISRNIGPTSVSLQAMAQGSLDVYPEYLNVWNASIANNPRTYPTELDAYGAAQNYAAAHAMALLNPTPFSDTDGIAVTTAYANAHRLRTVEDLRRVATTMTLGAPPEFTQSSTGLPALESAYGFQPAATTSVDIGSQYAELQSGAIQAAYVDTTDPQLSTSEFRVLRDPRHVLGYGNVVPVLTSAVLASEGPTFTATLNQVDALLSTRVMRQLNAEQEIGNQTPIRIARDFLEAHGILPASGTA